MPYHTVVLYTVLYYIMFFDIIYYYVKRNIILFIC